MIKLMEHKLFYLPIHFKTYIKLKWKVLTTAYLITGKIKGQNSSVISNCY